jgi:cobyrinic acid a,c-diamide synthase
MSERLTLGYRHARTTAPPPLGPRGVEVRGHEFHYSTVSPRGGALSTVTPGGTSPPAFARPRLLASYLHVHLGAAPELVAAFVRSAAVT